MSHNVLETICIWLAPALLELLCSGYILLLLLTMVMPHCVQSCSCYLQCLLTLSTVPCYI